MIGEEQIEGVKQSQQQYDFYEPIEKAFEWNSARLLELIMGECQLVQRLESINNYFFFKRGDVFSHFIDGCEEILESFSSEVKMEKIESYLEMAIRTSSANSDPFKDDVTCVLNSYGLSEQLIVTCLTRGALGSRAYGAAAGHQGISTAAQNPILNIGQTSRNMKVYEAFTLDYKVRWPLTLVLSKRSINKYQLIFRHLLQCKYVEKSSENVWLQQQSTKECDVQSALQ